MTDASCPAELRPWQLPRRDRPLPLPSVDPLGLRRALVAELDAPGAPPSAATYGIPHLAHASVAAVGGCWRRVPSWRQADLVDLWVAESGVEAVVAAAIAGHPQHVETTYAGSTPRKVPAIRVGDVARWLRLRWHLAAARDDAFQGARALAADAWRDADQDLRLALLAAFPDEVGWADELASRPSPWPPHSGVAMVAFHDPASIAHALSGALSVARATVSFPALRSPPLDGVLVPLVAALEVLGRDIVPYLARGLRRWERDRRAVAKVLSGIGTEACFAALVDHVDDAGVVAELAEGAVRHPGAAVRPLLDAVDRKGPASTVARTILPGVLRQPDPGVEAALAASAEPHRERARRARGTPGPVAAIEQLPACLRGEGSLPLPSFWHAPSMPPVELTDGRAVPVAGIERLGALLADRAGCPRDPELAEVRRSCTASSLAAFSWELFQRWQLARSPLEEVWAVTQLGRIGDDACVARLAALLPDWPPEHRHPQAVAALDAFVLRGTPEALRLLGDLALRCRRRVLRQRAAERLAEVAEARGTTVEDLADTVVPDLGLDAWGTTLLDLGGRSLRAGVGADLAPCLVDAGGGPLDAFPPRTPEDDPAAYDAAVRRWEDLRRRGPRAARVEASRLERALVAGRRWSPGTFRSLVLGRPLSGVLARRLVWGAWDDGGRLRSCFLVADRDRLVEVQDDAAVTLGADDRVGLVHPIDLPEDRLAAIAEAVADLGLVQPFPQLGREVVRLADDEPAATTFDRWRGREVPTERLYRLEHRGWLRGPIEENGAIHLTKREVAPGVEGVLDLDPWMFRGQARDEPQGLGGVRFEVDGRPQALGAVAPRLVSEVLRDVAWVVRA